LIWTIALRWCLLSIQSFLTSGVLHFLSLGTPAPSTTCRLLSAPTSPFRPYAEFFSRVRQSVYCTTELHDLFCRAFCRIIAEIPNLGVLKADDAYIGGEGAGCASQCSKFCAGRVPRTFTRMRTLSVVGSMTLPLSVTWTAVSGMTVLESGLVLFLAAR